MNISSEDRERSYRSRLDSEPLPAVVIDCATAEVLAANRAGLSALGLSPADPLPAPLDSAMPAIAALRDLPKDVIQNPVSRILVFWRHGRTATSRCRVSANDARQPTHLTVVFRPDVETDEQEETIAVAKAIAADDDGPPRIVRDDGETLKEIARRIREGRADKTEIDNTAVEAPASKVRGNTNVIIESLAVRHEEMMEPSSSWDSHRRAPDAKPDRSSGALPVEDIAKLAHELKTPLTAIAAAAEIMRDERLGAMGNDKYLGYAADIHDSATHALAVIGEMLASAPADPRPAGEKESFDLTDLAQRTVSALKPLAAQRQLTLSVDAEPALMPVRANATAVRQILLNLLTNALKFTAPGGDVRVVTGYLDDGAVYLVVRDTGDGMSESALAHIFDDVTETLAVRTGGGRGIGLRLVRRLAAENGAAFEIDTAPGKGTVVLVAFPKDLVGTA